MKLIEIGFLIGFLFTATEIIRAQEIIEVSKSGDLNKVRELTVLNPQVVNSKDENGRTPLIWACLNDKAEVVRFLADNGADVNIPDMAGISPLFYSIWYGHNYETDETLVNHGADVNFTRGKSVLFFAAQQGKEKTVKLLINRGADLNRINSVGKTPLYIAVEYNRPEIVKILLENKADVRVKDNFGRSPLHQAAIEGYLSVTELLVSAGMDINEKDNLGKTPFYYAELHGNKKVAGLIKSVGGKTGISERNFGNSGLLSKRMNSGDAVIWYLGHSGWAVKTRTKLLIFDYWERGRPDEPLLANGRINPEEIRNLDVYVFVSHLHEDHYNEMIFDWEKSVRKITYIFGWENEKDEKCISMSPREKRMIGDMEVNLLNSAKADPLDNAFLVKTDGISIYHAGDYGLLGGVAKITDIYSDDMNWLKSQADRLDIMFMSGRLLGNKIPEYIPYTISTVNPVMFFLMHQEAMEYNLKVLADELVRSGYASEIIAPLDRGQIWLYSKKKVK